MPSSVEHQQTAPRVPPINLNSYKLRETGNFTKDIQIYNQVINGYKATEPDRQMTTTDGLSEDPHNYYYGADHQNPYMHEMYFTDTYVIKKKANYRERLTCGLLSVDNVYKIYEWNEQDLCKERRLVRF